MSPLDWVWAAVGLILQSMVICTMLRGWFRKYPFVFAYILFSFFSTVLQLSFLFHLGRNSKEFIRAYWFTDFVGTFLVLMVIIHMIRTAMAGHPQQKPVYAGLLLGVVATAAGSVFLMQMSNRHLTLSRWMTEVSRDYYFGAVLLNAILWLTLMRRHHENKQLYLLTSGLGLKLCGSAIGHALRLTGAGVMLAGQFLVVTYLVSLYVWFAAMKKAPVDAPVGEFSASPP